jgi:hypothetical protein
MYPKTSKFFWTQQALEHEWFFLRIFDPNGLEGFSSSSSSTVLPRRTEDSSMCVSGRIPACQHWVRVDWSCWLLFVDFSTVYISNSKLFLSANLWYCASKLTKGIIFSANKSTLILTSLNTDLHFYRTPTEHYKTLPAEAILIEKNQKNL